ncbi:MAG: TonB-dependent receptor domain-containing protein [Gammaproteobacteria bacterium]
MLLTVLPPATAATQEAPAEVAELERLVVVSTRSPRPFSEVVGMVTVLDDRDIAAIMATSEDGLWRYTPGIEVESSGARFQARSLSVRGVGGNRVLMEVDGIPIQELFTVGNFADAGRTGSEIEFIRRVEVLRGPASSLFGSRAIGGVVSVSTFDPLDLAIDSGAPGGQLSGSFASDWDAFGASAIAGWQHESVGFLLGASHRQGNEPDRSANPPAPDRLDRDRQAVLAKLTLRDDADNRLRLTLDVDGGDTTSRINSVIGQGRFANTTDLHGDDRVTRTGAAIDGDLAWRDYVLEGAAFHRETETRQDTVELREALARPVRVDRHFRYDTTYSGMRVRISRQFEHGSLRHRLMLGAEYSRSLLKEMRDASLTGIVDGETSNVLLGERFPRRDFPVTESHETGIFLQDEIDWKSGRWSVIPSLRFDHTRIRIREDDVWRQTNPQAEAAEPTVSDLSPRLGVLWSPSLRLQAWGQVASGFRAPPAEDLNIGLDIPLFKVRALPNPELDSETSLGWELGLRSSAAAAWFSVAAFWTDYEDFIVSLVPLGPEPETGTLLFQSQNVARARIRGIEFEAELPLSQLTPVLDAFKTGVSGYWAEGEDRRSGAKLADVGPPSAVLFLDWSSPSAAWGLRLNGTFARGKQVDGVDDEAHFRVPGHGILDLIAFWQASERLTLRGGLFNFTDKTWWRWGDARNLPAEDPLIPSRSAPGRSFSVSFKLGLGPGRL